jgi:NADH-quinone oxidoreductase subunit J
VQLLLYAGGIVTIVVFAIVVTERLVGERLTQTNMRIGGGVLVAVVMFGFIASVLMRRPLATSRPEMPGDLTRILGQAVLTRYVLPFEMLAVLMLVGMLGAMYFARPED